MSYRQRPDGYDPLKWGMAGPDRRRRRETRWLLLLGLLLVAAWPLAQVGLADPDDRVIPNFALLLPLILGSAYSPFARANWLTARGRAGYDEFEREAFARATTWAYVLFLALMLAVFGYLWAAAAFAWPMPRSAAGWGACAMSILLIGTALPLTLAEFLVPMPPPGDEWN